MSNEWPPKLQAAADRQEEENEVKPTKQSQPFDIVGKVMTYVVGIGLIFVFIAIFFRLVMWILGVHLG